jgi:hypothetical protein
MVLLLVDEKRVPKTCFTNIDALQTVSVEEGEEWWSEGKNATWEKLLSA